MNIVMEYGSTEKEISHINESTEKPLKFQT